jgi:hypothetical protein
LSGSAIVRPTRKSLFRRRRRSRHDDAVGKEDSMRSSAPSMVPLYTHSRAFLPARCAANGRTRRASAWYARRLLQLPPSPATSDAPRAVNVRRRCPPTRSLARARHRRSAAGGRNDASSSDPTTLLLRVGDLVDRNRYSIESEVVKDPEYSPVTRSRQRLRKVDPGREGRERRHKPTRKPRACCRFRCRLKPLLSGTRGLQLRQIRLSVNDLQISCLTSYYPSVA